MRDQFVAAVGRVVRRTVLAVAALSCSAMVSAAVITAGTPTTTVPTHLTDGSYLFFVTVPDPLPPNQFLLPVEITGAAGLQSWQFDLTFDSFVVGVVEPFDGTSGIYGAEFTPGDANSLSFILGGFPLNFLGQVSGVAGSYPSLPSGPSGDGVLAYILFETIGDGDPGFGIDNPTVIQQAPEPGTVALLAAALLTLVWLRRARGITRARAVR